MSLESKGSGLLVKLAGAQELLLVEAGLLPAKTLIKVDFLSQESGVVSLESESGEDRVSSRELQAGGQELEVEDREESAGGRRVRRRQGARLAA